MNSRRSTSSEDLGPPKVLSTATRARIMLYLGGLIMLLGLGAPHEGLIDLPISFFLKNKLHLSAARVADFRLIAALPLYLSFIFGFTRDTWSPLGLGDRGYLILFGTASAALYVLFAFIPVTYLTLLSAVILLTTAVLFVSSAQKGMTAAFGQQHVMSGQISTAWNVFLSLPLIAAFLLGGVLSDMLEGRNADQAARVLFLVGAGAMALVALYGVWKPRRVFDHLHDEHAVRAHPISDLKRLLTHWPIYPALLIWFLFTFSPGSVTPLQFYLQNTLHASDAQWGEWNAVFVVAFIPTYLLFGVLCQKVALRKLLFWGTVIGVPQMVPLAFVHSVNGGLVAAAAIGLMGGVCTAAYYDLIIRSCPAGLQGTTWMIAGALYYVAVRFGDILGTHLYDHFHNFNACVIAITIVYALILPVLLLVPKELTATADGQTVD
jgi:hypothetical protein